MPSSASHGNPVPAKHVEYRDTKSGGVLVNMMTGECFELNRVSADVWKQLSAGHALDEVARAISARYETALDTVLADVRHVCDELVAARLLRYEDE